MRAAESERRALQRELLLLRAATERAAFANQLDQLQARSRQGLPGLLLGDAGGERRSALLRLAASAVRTARAQPWLVPTIVGGLTRAGGSRVLRWIALAAIAAGTYWWFRHRADAAEAAAATEDVGAVVPGSDDE